MVRKRAYCVDCPQLGVEDPNGYCKRFNWEISVKLARADKVCSYDSFKDKFFDEDNTKNKDNLKAWKKDW